MLRFSAFFLSFCMVSSAAFAASPEALVRPVYGPDGRFLFCLAEARLPEGRKVSVAHSPLEEINLGVTLPGGGFEPQGRYDLDLALDARPPRKIRAAALSETELLFQMGVSPSFRANLETARTLHISGGGNKLSLPLPTMKHVFQRLSACQEENAGKTRPIADPSAFPPALALLLEKAGLKDAQPLDLGDTPEDERPADHMWQIGSVLGGIRERRQPEGKSLSDLIGLYLEGLRRKCPAGFSSTLDREQTPGSGFRLRTASVSCGAETAEKVEAAVIFYTTPAGGFSVITHEALAPNGPQAQKARDQIVKTLKALARGPS